MTKYKNNNINYENSITKLFIKILILWNGIYCNIVILILRHSTDSFFELDPNLCTKKFWKSMVHVILLYRCIARAISVQNPN